MPKTKKRALSVPERHQLRVALDTLKMNDVMARVMGGPSKEEARVIVKRLTGKTPRENPRRRKNPLEYRTVDTTTVKGIEEAEKLQAAGWKMIRPGMFSIQFERKTAPKRVRVRRRKNPALGDVKVLAPNVTTVQHGSNLILYSYNTPVAILAPSGMYRTSQKWSTTTSRHINRWFAIHNLDPKGALALPQDIIESYARNGVDPISQRGKNPPRRTLNPVEQAWKFILRLPKPERDYAEKVLAQWTLIGRVSTLPSGQAPLSLGTKVRYEIEEKLKEILGNYSQRNPRRTTGRTLRRKKIASSHRRKRYEFFRKSSVAGLDKPSETAARAKQLADAERWAHEQGVEYRYYYGRDADEESENEWDGRIVAEHPDGTEADAYGYLGNDYSQSHVRAEAALALMHEMKGKLKRRNAPTRGRVHAGKRVRVLRRKRNPAIGILGNPPSNGKYLGKVTYIEYTHGSDGQNYYHDFKPAVYAEVMNDGSVRLSHPTNKLWKLFPETK
jgi:hypothetical protein